MYHVRFFSHTRHTPTRTVVYVPTSRNTVALAVVSMHSFDRHVQGLNFIVLDSGDITIVQKWILRHIGIPLEIIGAQDVSDIRAKLEKYTHLLQYFDYGWSGRKFFVPLLRTNVDKFILLDVDILTYTIPRVVINWIVNKRNTNLYMEDYKNFSVLSHIEMKSMLKKKLRHGNINTGFLCIDRQQVLQTVSLKKLNLFVKELHTTIADRMTRDLKTTNPIDYVYPMIEQTLYWYIFEHTKSAALSARDYVIFPRHILTHGDLSSPVMIHFSGESDKESEYKYLWMSLVSWSKMQSKPWYAQSLWYCMACKNHKHV